MDDHLCACGCGTQVATATARFVRGHHGRGPGGFKNLPPVEKVCERCGRRYSRSELTSRQSNRHWAARRYCSQECRKAAASDDQPSGPQSANWKGDDAGQQAGRKRARRLYPGRLECEICGRSPAERHHKDGNTRNNRRDNVAFLCREHHIAAEDRMAYVRVEITAQRLARKRALAAARARRYRARRRENQPSEEFME